MKTEMKYTLDGIFPTPIYQSSNIKEFTKEELDFVKDNENKVYENVGNTTSLDSFVLDKPIFKELREILTSHINNYFQKIYAPKNKDLKLYITQSWLNYTTKGGWHHPHAHQNSFCSGGLYFKADKKVDKIFFEKRPSYDNKQIFTDTYHVFNSSYWSFDTETGMLLIFPSTNIHSVKRKEDDNLRISLSFNTFIRGTLGHRKGLSELKL